MRNYMNIFFIKNINIYNICFIYFYDKYNIFFEYSQKMTKQPFFTNIQPSWGT
jgi:hypothetical protein